MPPTVSCRPGPIRRAVVALLLIGSTIGLSGCLEEDRAQADAAPRPPPQVSVATPVVKQIVEDDEFVGRFDAVEEVVLRARVGGYLQEVAFEDGQMVEAGQLLFRIDPRPFATALNQSRAELASARAALQNSRSELERAEALIGRGNISRQALDERREAFLVGQARVAAAQAAVERSELDMEYTEIRAPIAGRIDRNLISVGNLVQANQTALTTLISTDPIHFYFDIDERSYLAYARDARTRGAELQEGAGGLSVSIRLSDERAGPFAGWLDFSENRLDPESGTMRVRAVVPNPDLVLQPGLFGRVNVPGSLPHRGVLLPDEAIASDQNRRIVYVLNDENAVRVREVRPGPRIDGYRVIRDGLTGDERVVVNGLMRVRPGVVVDPQAVDLPPTAE